MRINSGLISPQRSTVWNEISPFLFPLQISFHSVYKMAVHRHSILFPCVLYLLQISIVCHSVRPSINKQSEITVQKTSEVIPDAWSLIGTSENITYWQESLTLSQSSARVNCGGFGRQLIRPKNKDHLDFVIFEDALEGSWTDGITFYTRELYLPAVDSTIPIVHYTNLALKIQKPSLSLIAENANVLLPSICSVATRPDKVKSPVEIAGINEDKSVDNVDPVIPSAVIYLGTYNGYQYYQDTLTRTQSAARSNCETLGLHLATFLNKAHLDFISVQGAMDGSWTAYVANKTRDLYKWGDGSQIAADIPIIQYPTNLGLIIGARAGNHRLQAEMENVPHPSICMLHIA